MFSPTPKILHHIYANTISSKNNQPTPKSIHFWSKAFWIKDTQLVLNLLTEDSNVSGVQASLSFDVFLDQNTMTTHLILLYQFPCLHSLPLIIHLYIHTSPKRLPTCHSPIQYSSITLHKTRV
jgi:hypothetical protein